jgi:excisionase family DNA binding protein
VRVVREAVRAGELRAVHPSDSPRRWLVAPIDAQAWRALAEQEAFSVRELGERYSVAPDTIRRAIRAGALRAYRPGGSGDYRITLNDWRGWFFANPVGGLDCGIERLRKVG